MFEALINSLLQHQALSEQRNQKKTLDDETLKDIGLTRYELEQTSEEPVWDAPDHWKRPTANQTVGGLPRGATIY